MRGGHSILLENMAGLSYPRKEKREGKEGESTEGVTDGRRRGNFAKVW